MKWEYRFHFKGTRDHPSVARIAEALGKLDEEEEERTDYYWVHSDSVGLKERGSDHTFEIKVKHIPETKTEDKDEKPMGLERWAKLELPWVEEPDEVRVNQLLTACGKDADSVPPLAGVTKVKITKKRIKYEGKCDGEITTITVELGGQKSSWVSVAVEKKKLKKLTKFLDKNPFIMSQKASDFPDRINGGYPAFVCEINRRHGASAAASMPDEGTR